MSAPRPLGGPPGPDEVRRRRILRVVAVLLVLAVAMPLAVVAATQGSVAAMVATGFALILGIAALATSRTDRRRRREQLATAFGGSLEAARASLDQDAVRALRDTEGELAATRAVKQQLPMLSLEQAIDIVRSL